MVITEGRVPPFIVTARIPFNAPVGFVFDVPPPSMVTPPVMSLIVGKTVVKLTMPTEKVIISGPALALACVIAHRSEAPSPVVPLSVLVTG